MDLICFTCGEPWEIDFVVNEDPDAFERVHGRITHCPACAERKHLLRQEDREHLDAMSHVAELFGDDLDGLACFLEDHTSE